MTELVPRYHFAMAFHLHRLLSGLVPTVCLLHCVVLTYFPKYLQKYDLSIYLSSSKIFCLPLSTRQVFYFGMQVSTLLSFCGKDDTWSIIHSYQPKLHLWLLPVTPLPPLLHKGTYEGKQTVINLSFLDVENKVSSQECRPWAFVLMIKGICYLCSRSQLYNVPMKSKFLCLVNKVIVSGIMRLHSLLALFERPQHWLRNVPWVGQVSPEYSDDKHDFTAIIKRHTSDFVHHVLSTHDKQATN